MTESGLVILKESSVEETDPVDYTEQPKFLNQVIIVSTALDPQGVLHITQKIENDLGRVRVIDKGPRTIDIDILLYDDVVYCDDDLTIPHHAIGNRDFVLRHILQIDDSVCDPRCGRRLSEVYNEKFGNQNNQ
jgi:2-amino-4-hydroxy-6-hydroxymethyldihydropteridine diphosphokinase